MAAERPLLMRRHLRAWLIGLGLVIAIGVAGQWIDVAKLTVGVKGDKATYVAMAFSLADDGDLQYRPEDYQRFRQVYGTGPEGIFLKRGYQLHWHLRAGWPPITLTRTPVPTTDRLEYAKSFAYPVLAAPFVRLFGLPGLLELNLLLLAVCVACAMAFCRARLGRWPGTILGIAFVGASVVPAYGVWFTPELFNVALVFAAYFLWLYKKVAPPSAARLWQHPMLDVVAAFLLGVATFSKLSNGLLVAPLVIDVLLRRAWVKSAVIIGAFVVGSAGLFAVNGLISGDWNYQGGGANDRKYFVTHFPFDQEGTSFDVGTSMVTNQANDQHILAPSFLFPHLRDNIPYFLLGRDAGLVPYFFPGVVVFVLWLWRIRQSTVWQWTTCLALMGSALGLLILAPDIWNGGGGPIGNRYFLAIYPTMLFLLPAGARLLPGLVALVIGTTFVGPILVRPFEASREVWLNPERWPLRLLPVELTIMEQLPVRLTLLRSRVEVSRDPEVFLYYMDGNTYFQEANGFWVAPGTADIVIRTERPLTVLTLKLSSPIPNDVDVSIDGSSDHVSLRPLQTSTLRLTPSPGVFASASYQIVLRIKTANGFYPRQITPGSQDARHLGVFVSPTYQVAAPPPSPDAQRPPDAR